MSNYDDIINHPHHVSREFPPMSLYERAAQFAPFAALTGYEESLIKALQEVERQAKRKDEPSPDEEP